MGLYLNLGNELLKQNMNSEIYIDKSMLISKTNEAIDTADSFWCVTRMRRSGKTMALSMLNAYYSKGCDSRNLFDNLKIAKDPSFEKHLNKHNVIWIDMGGAFCSSTDKSSFLPKLQRDIINDLREAFPSVDFEGVDENIADTIAAIKNEANENFIFLIDEWDIVFSERPDDKKLQEDYHYFLRSLFKNSTIDGAIDFVYMTGILPINKGVTQSGLNNFNEFNMLDPEPLSEFFGFTQEEVDSLCDKFDMDKEEMRHWYNGYHYNSFDLYNPWSVDNAIQDKECDTYWNRTCSTKALTNQLNYNNGELKEATIRLLAGEEVTFNSSLFDNDLTKIHHKDAALTVLVHFGYLAYNEDNHSCRIPNYEISQEFVKALKLLEWKEIENPITGSDRLIKETFLGNTDYINDVLDKNHKELASPFNKNKEDVLGIIVEISYYNMIRDYDIRKEETNILGRADIIYHPLKPGKPALIVELKVDDTPENAIKQIEEKGYLRSLAGFKGKAYLLGISYDSKSLKHTSRIKVVEI